MYYYKELNKDGTLASLSSSSNHVSEELTGLISISKEEFDEISDEMNKRAAEAERLANESILAEQERIANLEKENAALLFQVLTGEEYADV